MDANLLKVYLKKNNYNSLWFLYQYVNVVLIKLFYQELYNLHFEILNK